MAHKKAKAFDILRQDVHLHTEIWIREIFLLFYGVFFLCSIMNDLLPGHASLHYLLLTAQAVHAPGLIFAAGCLVGMQDPSTAESKKNNLKSALYSYLAFLCTGFFREVFLKGREAFSTMKDLMTLIRVPAIGSIFLTLCFLFLISAFWGKYINHILNNRFMILILSAAGLLFLFVPKGILGYGLTGVFIGGDLLNCIPIAYYLFVFFAGIRFFQDTSYGLLQKKAFAIMGCLTVLCLVLLLFHQKEPAVILFGILCAWFALVITAILFPFYRFCESGIRNTYQKLKSKSHIICRQRQEKKYIDIIFYYSGYCIVFAFTAFFVFLPYIWQDRTLIWTTDSLGQYLPKAYRFVRYIPSVVHDILHGNPDFMQYDFSSGLGSAITVSHEPLYWLFLLFKPSQIESVYNCLIVVRYFLAGLSMSFMLRYFRKSDPASCLGSMVYAFSGYAIYAGTRHGQFLVPMILLPLLIVSMEELITKKQWYFLTVMTALSLLCSYYFLYMNTIALGIYFIARILSGREYRNFRTFFTRGLLIAGSYCIGAAIGSVTLFTSFGGYIGSSRSTDASVSNFLSATPLFYRGQWITDLFVSFISDSFSPGLWLKIGLAPAAFLALIFLFTRSRKKELKPLFILLTVFCILPVCGYIFNGFGNVSNRWIYIYVAVIVFILAEYFDDFQSLTNTEIRVMTGFTVFYGLIIFFSTKYRTDAVFGAFGLLTLTFIFVLLLNTGSLHIPGNIGKLILFGITLFSVIINANIYINGYEGDEPRLNTFIASGSSFAKMSETALKYLDEAAGGPDYRDAEKGFYRSTNLLTPGYIRSSSLLYGYNDLSTFTSTLNSSIVNYNKMMGNCEYTIVSIFSYNFRTIMNELACVRYMGTDQSVTLPLPYGYKEIYSKESGEDTYSIYENEFALPLGYTYSSVVPEDTAEKKSAAERQELTLTSAIVNAGDCERDRNIGINSDPSLSVHSLPITKTKLNNVTMDNGLLTIGEGGGSVTFYFDGEENSETCLSFQGDIVFPKDGAEHFIFCDITSEGVSYEHKFRVDAYSTGQEEYLFNLGYHKEGIHSCTMQFHSAGELTYDDIRIFSQDMESYEKAVSDLKENVLENVRVNKNTVTGSISTSKDKMLVIALPYQKGWTAYVDGSINDLQCVNYQYMGLNLPAGEHSIRLHYQRPGLKLSFFVTGGGLALFLCTIFFHTVRKRRKKNISD